MCPEKSGAQRGAHLRFRHRSRKNGSIIASPLPPSQSRRQSKELADPLRQHRCRQDRKSTKTRGLAEIVSASNRCSQKNREVIRCGPRRLRRLRSHVRIVSDATIKSASIGAVTAVPGRPRDDTSSASLQGSTGGGLGCGMVNADENPPLVNDPAREAAPSIRGYWAQIWRSVLAWMELGEAERLYLEGAEDFDRVSGLAAETSRSRMSRETSPCDRATLSRPSTTPGPTNSVILGTRSSFVS
jgi:hypothetical protein